MFRICCLALVLGTAMSGVANGQRVEAVASVDSARIGARFLLTVTALHGFSENPVFPDPVDDARAFGDLEDVKVVASGHTVLGPSARLDSIVYDVTTFSLDSVVIPPVAVVLHGGTRKDSTERMVIPVVSVVPADADTIRGMAEAVAFLRPDPNVMPAWPWVLLGLVVLVLGGLLWYRYTRGRTEVVQGDASSPPQRSPYELAMIRLRALEKADLQITGSEVPYFVELSETLRTYLEHRIGVTALELTTSEILVEISRVRYKIPSGVPDQLQRVLTLSDMVKFAEFTPPVSDSVAALAEARRTIDRLEEKQAQLAADEARQQARN